MLIRHDTLTKQQYVNYMQKYYTQLMILEKNKCLDFNKETNKILENGTNKILSILNKDIKISKNESLVLSGKFRLSLGNINHYGAPLTIFLMSTIKQLEYTDLFRSMNKQRCNTQQIIQIVSPVRLESIFNNMQEFNIPLQSFELWLPEYGEKCKFAQSRLEPKAGYIHGIHGAIAPFSHYLLDDEFKTPVYYVPMYQEDSNIHYNLIEPDNLKAQSKHFQSFNEESEIPF